MPKLIYNNNNNILKNKLSNKYDYEEKCILQSNDFNLRLQSLPYYRKFITFSDLSSVDLGLKTELEFVVYKRNPNCRLKC